MPRWIAYTGSGSFTVPADYAGPNAYLIAIGGGGGGGRGDIGTNPSGGGGGGGAIAIVSLSSITAGQTIYYNAGTGGAGATSNNTSGSSGNQSWMNVNANTQPSSGGDGPLASGGAGGDPSGSSVPGGNVGYGSGYSGGYGAGGLGGRCGGGGGGAAGYHINNGGSGATSYGSYGGGGGGVSGAGGAGTSGGAGVTALGGYGGQGGNGPLGTSTAGATAASGSQGARSLLYYLGISNYSGSAGGASGGAANTNTGSGTGGAGGNAFVGGGGGGGGSGQTASGNGGNGGTGLVIFVYIPTNLYWIGGSGTWSYTNGDNWSNSSGGSGGYGIPSYVDTAYYFFSFTNSTVRFTSGSHVGTSTFSVAVGQDVACNSLIVSSPAYTMTLTGGLYPLRIYGNVSLSATNLFWTLSGITILYDLVGTTKSIDTAGVTVNGAWKLQGTVGTEWRLASNFVSNGNIDMEQAGIFNTMNYNMSVDKFTSSNTSLRTLSFGTSTITVYGSGTAWNCSDFTNLSISPNSATINMTSGSAKTFSGGTSGISNWNGASLTQGGAGDLTITGTNWFYTLTCLGARKIKFPTSTSTRAAIFNIVGASPTSRATLESVTSGSQAPLEFFPAPPPAAQNVVVQNTTVKDMYAASSPPYSYFALTTNGNVDGGNNTGWIFTAPGFFMFF